MNLERLRKIAGLPVVKEWSDDDNYDDDLSPAERALADKADKDLERKGVKVKAAPEKDLAKLARDKKEDKADKDADEDEKSEKEQRAAAKKEAEAKRTMSKPSDKEEDDSPEERHSEKDDDEGHKRGNAVFGNMVKQAEKIEKKPEGEAKKRGRSETDRSKQFRDWVIANPNATRSEALRHAQNNLGMNARHANTKFYQYRKSVKEFFILVNPLTAKVLAESSTADRPVWVKYEAIDAWESMIYESREDAQAAASKLALFGFPSVLMQMGVSEDADMEDCDPDTDSQASEEEEEHSKKVGYYVDNVKGKCVAGPFKTESEAKKKADQMGGEEKGFTTCYVSDYSARRSAD